MAEALRKITHPIPEKRRAKLVALLNDRLAATADLQMQVKQAHWNVTGIHFYSLHQLFDDVADAIHPFVDVLAERVTALGGVAKGTVRMAAAASSLPEYPLDTDGGEAHLTVVRDRLAKYASDNLTTIDAAAKLDDAATEDLFTEIQREIDKLQYFVASHLV